MNVVNMAVVKCLQDGAEGTFFDCRFWLFTVE